MGTQSKLNPHQSMRRLTYHEKGLTLIELMFSFGLFGLVVASSFFSLIVAHQMSEDSRSKLLALNAARTTLEVIKDTPLANVPSMNTTGFVPADLPSGAISITTNPASVTTASIATITVTVTWAGSKNMPRQLEVTTMRSAY